MALASYFVKISQIRDQLKAIDEKASNKELVVVALVVSLDLGTHLLQGLVQERMLQLLISYGEHVL